MTLFGDDELTLRPVAQSEADDPWLAAGLSPAEIRIWRAAMLESVPRQVWNECREPDAPFYVDCTPQEEDLATVASRWRSLGFEPRDVTAWTQALDFDGGWMSAPEVAEQWRTRKFSPEEAHHWSCGEVAPCDDAEHSRIFRDAGWHRFTVWTLYCFLDRDDEAWTDRKKWADLPVELALSCARAGLTPSEAASFVGADEKVLERYLDARFDTRSRIEPFTAMLFNHHQALAYGPGDEDEACWPSYARHLWDLHDEEDDRANKRGNPAPYGGPRTVKPHWKRLEEHAGWVKSESPRLQTPLCPNSGESGQIEFRDGFEEWKVRCPECGTTWAGGGQILPNHYRR